MKLIVSIIRSLRTHI